MEMYRPDSLDGALEALAAHPNALVLAGGTDVMVEVNLHHRRPDVVVSVRRIAELQTMTDGFIGAGVTWARLESVSHRALAEAARTVGSPQIRAAGTLGGNLGTASPAGDALPFLVAAEAVVVLASTEGERRVPIGEFLVGPKETSRRPGELIIGVELDEDVPDQQAFAKIGIRQAMVIATASVCVLRSLDGSTRVALGSVGPTVLRAADAEALASSHTIDGDLLEEFAGLVSAAARPITDHRATAEYRRHAVGVIARRSLERVVAA